MVATKDIKKNRIISFVVVGGIAVVAIIATIVLLAVNSTPKDTAPHDISIDALGQLGVAQARSEASKTALYGFSVYIEDDTCDLLYGVARLYDPNTDFFRCSLVSVIAEMADTANRKILILTDGYNTATFETNEDLNILYGFKWN